MYYYFDFFSLFSLTFLLFSEVHNERITQAVIYCKIYLDIREEDLMTKGVWH